MDSEATNKRAAFAIGGIAINRSGVTRATRETIMNKLLKIDDTDY